MNFVSFWRNFERMGFVVILAYLNFVSFWRNYVNFWRMGFRLLSFWRAC